MYDEQNLPPVIPNSGGHLRPKPEGTVAACVAPVDTEWPYPENWGKPEGTTMSVPKGGWLTCLEPRDSYYNEEFLQTSSPTGVFITPDDDQRAAELHELWKKRGFEVLVIEAKKTVGLTVVGEVAPEAVGEDILTPEGPEKLSGGDVVVICPRSGDLYRITPANRKKRYAEDGRIFAGDLPDELR